MAAGDGAGTEPGGGGGGTAGAEAEPEGGGGEGGAEGAPGVLRLVDAAFATDREPMHGTGF